MDKEFSCPYTVYVSRSRKLLEYEELEQEIKRRTGKDLACIKALLNTGWTLEPPKKNDV